MDTVVSKGHPDPGADVPGGPLILREEDVKKS